MKEALKQSINDIGKYINTERDIPTYKKPTFEVVALREKCKNCTRKELEIDTITNLYDSGKKITKESIKCKHEALCDALEAKFKGEIK